MATRSTATHITPWPELGEREPDVWVHEGGSLEHISVGKPLMTITANVTLDQRRMKDLALALLPNMERKTLVAIRNEADARLDALDGAAEEAATSQPCGEPGCKDCADADGDHTLDAALRTAQKHLDAIRRNTKTDLREELLAVIAMSEWLDPKDKYRFRAHKLLERIRDSGALDRLTCGEPGCACAEEAAA